jgi:hypothetical protein
MTEKTFRDMLPLSDEQREFLSEPYGAKQNCDGCPCDTGTDCAKLLGVYPATCKVVRDKALILDNEFKANKTPEQQCKNRLWELADTPGMLVRMEVRNDHYLIIYNVYGCAEHRETISFSKEGDK